MKLEDYRDIVPTGEIRAIESLAERFKDKILLHINSTATGGGVAELLQRMVPLLQGLGIDIKWKVIKGTKAFFEITKNLHNALQGKGRPVSKKMWEIYEDVNERNAKRIDMEADCVFIHDPQPALLINHRKNGIWVWRCHIDISTPDKTTWYFMKGIVERYDGALYSVSKFAQAIPIPQFMIPPSIDPLSKKNRDMTPQEVQDVMDRLQIPRDKPILLQVSRFDPWKDPLGVIEAYRIVKRYRDCRLILAGGAATDDPEGIRVLAEVQEAASGDPDIHILPLPPGSDIEINALQRAADIVLQKSIKEGFGLVVSEALWKGRPVIGGAVGGIPLQIIDGVTGFLVHSVEGTAFRIRQLLNNPEMAKKMGEKGKEYVRTNFLITRQIRDYLSVCYSLENKGKNILEV